MSTEVWIAIIGAIGSLVTGGIGHWNGGRLAHKKLDGEQQLAKDKQAVDQYSVLLDELKRTYNEILTASEQRRSGDVKVLIDRMEKLEKALAECNREHIESARQIGELRGEMHGRMNEIRQQVNYNATEATAANKLAADAKATANVASDMSQTALVNLPPPKEQ